MMSSYHSHRDRPATAQMVGRDRELAQLGDALHQASRGHGSPVLVSGEAGIGKTSLVQALISDAREQGALVLTGAAYDLSATPPYGPWLEITDRYRPADDLPDLPGVLKRGTGIGDLQSQMELFELARAFFAAVATVRPLVLVLEDLHWADQASLDLLRYLARQVTDQPILLVATYRDDEITRHHSLFQLLPGLTRESQAKRISLRAFTWEAVQELVRAHWSLRPDDEARLLDHLLTYAEGQPFFTVEVLRALEQHAILSQNPEGWELGDLSKVPIPTLVQQVIERRLAHLGEDSRNLLDVAAVIGHQVPLDLWQNVTGMSDGDLIRLLEQAAVMHLLEQSLDSQQVQFVHALTRHALYESILLPRKRHWHRRIAETLSQASTPVPDSVAYHYKQAGDSRAVEWLIRAGERAFQAHALSTAAERYEDALRLIPESGDVEQERERGWLHYRMGQLRQFSDPHRGIADLERARQIARQIDDPLLDGYAELEIGLLHCYIGAIRQGIAEMQASACTLENVPAADDSSSARGMANFYVAFWLAPAGPYNEAIAVQEKLLAEAGPHWERIAWALGASYAMVGRPVDAARELKRSRTELLLKRREITAGLASFTHLTVVAVPYFTDDPNERMRLSKLIVDDWTNSIDISPVGVNARIGCVDSMILDGRWNEARAILAGIPDTLAHFRQYAASRLGFLHRHQGNPELAWQSIGSVLVSGPETEPGDCFLFYVMPLQRLAASLSLDSGELETSGVWLSAHGKWLDWSGAVLGRADHLLLKAKLHFAEGDSQTSQEYGQLALKQANEPRQPMALIAIHRFLGELATQAEDLETADEHLTQSRHLAEACALPFERALTVLAQAELAIASGDQDDARRLLAEVRQVTSDLGARPTRERAEELLASLAPGPITDHAGLSRREREVLQLLVQGKSDREIAADLFISYRTVTNHVSSILRKLDVESRTAAATQAVRRELV